MFKVKSTRRNPKRSGNPLRIEPVTVTIATTTGTAGTTCDYVAYFD